MPLTVNRRASALVAFFALTAAGATPPHTAPATERVAARVRVEPLPEAALPTLAPHLIEPFLAEPLIVAEDGFDRAPRIVAAPEGRVLITQGSLAYARGAPGHPMEAAYLGGDGLFRIFRDARALRDPVTQAVLGHEARFLGRARLLQPEALPPAGATRGGASGSPVPAVLEIVDAREEIRAGDRLLPEPPREFRRYQPRTPQARIEGARIASMYGDAVSSAGQNQVVVINKGRADGLETGHLMALVKSGPQAADRTQPGSPQPIQLPDSYNGLLMVFRPFERLSYALILESPEGVRVGDRVVNPR